MALCTYEEPLRSMIHKLKYGNGWRLARPLGAIAAVKLAPLLQSPYPLVTFVPMHRRKRRARGYDHAERLARGVAAGLGLEVIPLLERTRATNPQANLSNQARRRNVKGVFRVRTDGFDGGGDLGGREVILVDDVLTTGSTIAESAKALKKGGAGKVIACVLARDLVTGSTSPGWQESP
jgi:ComF family protein